jgi:3-oxoacyl-[acyl-carrier protein] reductase
MMYPDDGRLSVLEGLTRLAPIRRQVNEADNQIKQEKERGMNELDFSGKQVLVVGGSSGIGNGIAHAFRGKGARVAVCGTRASAADYSPDDGSYLEGLDYFQLDVSKPQAVEAFKPPFEKLDVLVLAQGAVIYRRGEFEMEGFRKVLEVNLMSLMACATKFHDMLSASKGSLIIVSSTAAYHSTMGNPAYNASKLNYSQFNFRLSAVAIG